eukprot:5849-Heterococcus_DN1.PRE.4
MLLRVRSQVGQWRLTDVTPGTTVGELRAQLGREHNVDLSDSSTQPLTKTPNPSGKEPSLPTHASVNSLGLKHGDMLHLRLDESKVGMAHEEALGPKKINADGTIVQQSYEE